jgi:hypothetical protein
MKIKENKGSLAMGPTLERNILKDAKAVWLTPLLNLKEVFDATLSIKNKGLCIIGANHALEYDLNVIESINVIRNVVQSSSNSLLRKLYYKRLL